MALNGDDNQGFLFCLLCSQRFNAIFNVVLSRHSFLVVDKETDGQNWQQCRWHCPDLSGLSGGSAGNVRVFQRKLVRRSRIEDNFARISVVVFRFCRYPRGPFWAFCILLLLVVSGEITKPLKILIKKKMWKVFYLLWWRSLYLVSRDPSNSGSKSPDPEPS